MKRSRQRMYCVTMNHFGVTIVAVENNKYYVLCVCVSLAIQHA
jgi:hypothetical protein